MIVLGWSPAMRLKSLFLAIAWALSAMVAAAPARAEIEVNVNRGDVQPLPIAVPAFGGGQVGADIAQVIGANLQRSGLFRPPGPGQLRRTGSDVLLTAQFPRLEADQRPGAAHGPGDS